MPVSPRTAAVLAAVLALVGYRMFFAAGEIRNADPAGTNVICFGDSLTSGYGASAGMDYPAQLARLLGAEVINAGVAGDTTERALGRLEKDVLARDPRIVLITLGGNDLKNGVPKEKAFANLKRIITAIQDRGALVIVGGIDLPFYGRGFAGAYEEAAAQTQAILVPDILDGVFGKPSMMSDAIHPNDRGYRVMAERFHDAIPKHLK